MILRRIGVVIFAAALLVSCKEKDQSSVQYRPGVVLETSKDFLIPRQLKSKIEADYLELIRRENPKIVLSDEEVLARIPREFLDVDMLLHAPNRGALSENTVFRLPRGGGAVDLKNYVTGQRGSFILKFSAQRSNEPQASLHQLRIYFLSEVKSREIDGDIFGAGCGKYLEITRQLSDPDGFLLNATNARYYPVIGGTFYFVDFDPERKMYLAAVRVEDSRYPGEACPHSVQKATN